MPTLPPRACATCGKPTQRQYCAIHQLTTTQRGYGSDWVRARGNPRGQKCAIAGCPVRRGLHRNHRRPKSLGGTNAPSNLDPWMCAAHHAQFGLRSNTRVR